MRDVKEREIISEMQEKLGIDLRSKASKELGLESEDELQLHLQLDYKQSVEIAEEELLNDVLNRNKYDLTRRRICKILLF